jgi:dTDP-4-dehydrorhamnose reductase
VAGSDLLLISPDGMVGRAFAALLEARSEPARTVAWPAFDLTDPAAVERAVTPGTRVVINCCAWTDVDGAESHEAEALAINGTGVGSLARRCRDVGAVLVHFSTDYVFSGVASRPYPTDHPRAPLNAYGRTKARGEEEIEASGCAHLLIRTSWVYAPWGKNFVRTIARLAREREQLRVVADQRGRPTSAEHLAATTLALVETGARGTFHVTDGGETSWHGFAREIVARLGLGCRVEPCTAAEYPSPARRPAYSVLDVSGAEALLGVSFPEWREHLASVLARLE